MSTFTKELPPIPPPSKWSEAKYRVGAWLKKRLFPPPARPYYDLDTLWEDAAADERHDREHYPVRFRLEKAWEAASRWPRLEHAWYWVRTHTYNRYHILDLRKAEPEDPEGYRWGYLDPCHAIDLAMFLCLRHYWEHGNPVGGGPLPDPATWHPDATPEEVEQEATRVGSQLWQYRECRDLMLWWTSERFAERQVQEARYELRQNWPKDHPEYDRVMREWADGETAMEDRATQMRVRLARLAPYLWS